MLNAAQKQWLIDYCPNHPEGGKRAIAKLNELDDGLIDRMAEALREMVKPYPRNASEDDLRYIYGAETTARAMKARAVLEEYNAAKEKSNADQANGDFGDIQRCVGENGSR